MLSGGLAKRLRDRYSGDMFTVTLTSTTPHAEYDIRNFEVKNESMFVVVM